MKCWPLSTSADTLRDFNATNETYKVWNKDYDDCVLFEVWESETRAEALNAKSDALTAQRQVTQQEAKMSGGQLGGLPPPPANLNKIMADKAQSAARRTARLAPSEQAATPGATTPAAKPGATTDPLTSTGLLPHIKTMMNQVGLGQLQPVGSAPGMAGQQMQRQQYQQGAPFEYLGPLQSIRSAIADRLVSEEKVSPAQATASANRLLLEDRQRLTLGEQQRLKALNDNFKIQKQTALEKILLEKRTDKMQLQIKKKKAIQTHKDAVATQKLQEKWADDKMKRDYERQQHVEALEAKRLKDEIDDAEKGVKEVASDNPAMVFLTKMAVGIKQAIPEIGAMIQKAFIAIAKLIGGCAWDDMDKLAMVGGQQTWTSASTRYGLGIKSTISMIVYSAISAGSSNILISALLGSLAVSLGIGLATVAWASPIPLIWALYKFNLGRIGVVIVLLGLMSGGCFLLTIPLAIAFTFYVLKLVVGELWFGGIFW